MWKDWLAFTRKEQYGIIFLAVLIVMLVILRFLMVLIWKPPEINIISDVSQYIEFENKTGNLSGSEGKQLRNENSYHFKPFDPNHVTVTELDRMGLPHYVIINWIKYLESGGSFSDPDDIGKIYGLDSLLAQQLSHFVCFTGQTEQKNLYPKYEPADSASPASEISFPYFDDKEENNASTHLPVNTYVIEINSATASDFKQLNGIGDVLSKRIISYRELLGGFCRKEQICEVYGISKELYENIRHYLIVNKPPYRKMNINRASVSCLRKHPYLNFYQARDIVEYRKRNGNITSARELKRIESIDEQTFEKIVPYFKFFDENERRPEQKNEN
jgi:competence ComEA-like helix-hairpin-helix protein